MQTIENGAEILASIAGALGVRDAKSLKQRAKNSPYKLKDLKDRVKAADKDLEEVEKINNKIDGAYKTIRYAQRDVKQIKLDDNKKAIERFLKKSDQGLNFIYAACDDLLDGVEKTADKLQAALNEAEKL